MGPRIHVVARLDGGAAGPVPTLGRDLQRTSAIGIFVEQDDRVPRPVQPLQRGRPRGPGQGRIFVADSVALEADVGARREGIIDLAADVVSQLILAVGHGADGQQFHHFQEFIGVGRALGEIMRPGEQLASSGLIS